MFLQQLWLSGPNGANRASAATKGSEQGLLRLHFPSRIVRDAAEAGVSLAMSRAHRESRVVSAIGRN